MIAKRIIKIKFISLGNLIINKLAFKELIQNECNSDALMTEVRALIENPQYREKMLQDYTLIREALGGSGASSAVAKAMIQELKKNTYE
jgi:lipid-A-disaccharide synthase